jgi:hypothetical protein
MSKRVIVYHTGYGCDTGCCGHKVVVGDQSQFDFTHPWIWTFVNLPKV